MSLTTVRYVSRATVICLLAFISSMLVVTPATADTPTYLRLAHLSPDTPEVDVYVASVADPDNAMVILRGVGYGVLSEYQSLPSGTYTVSMRPGGAAADTPPVIGATLDAAAGSAYTVAGVGTFADLGLTILNDDLTLPPDGLGRARVIQAAATQPRLDITVQDGTSLGRGVAFGSTTGYTNVEPGQWTLQVSANSQSLAELPITIEAGSVYSLIVLDTPSGIMAAVQLDATAAGVVPVSGVETGAGGLARAAAQASAAPADSATRNLLLGGGLVITGLLFVGVACSVLVRAFRRERSEPLSVRG